MPEIFILDPKKSNETEGYKYTVSDDPTAEARLRYDIANNVNGMGQKHRQNISSVGKSLIEDDQSGAYVGFLSGLSNSPEAIQYWLGSRRFPNDIASGRNPNERYYIDPETDDVMFVDFDGVYGPKGNSYKEFENVTEWGDLDADDFASWMGPGAQLITEMVLGGASMAGGAALGTAMAPGAGTLGLGMTGGALGSAAGTAAGQGIRSTASYLLGGPESDMDQFVNDMYWSAGFGMLPIGLPKGTISATFRTIGDSALPKVGYLREKFNDSASQDIIRAVLKEGGGDVDKTIEAAAREGFQITRGEALKGIGEAAFAQRFLGQGSRASRLTEMYNDRAQRVANMVTQFADELSSGKYIPAGLKDPLSKKVRGDVSSFAEMDVAQAADDFIKKYAEQRSRQAGEIYKQAYDLDRAGTPELEALVDSFLTTNAIPNTSMNGRELPGILTRLKDPDLDTDRKAAYTELAEALSSKKRMAQFLAENEGIEGAFRPGYLAKNTSEEVAGVLQETFDKLISRYKNSTETQNKRLAAELSQIKASMGAAFDAYNPLYAKAKEIYSADDLASSLSDVKIISDIAKIAGAGGTETTRAVSRLFSGSAEPVDIFKLKAAVQEQNPLAWQRLKGDWLRTRFRDIQGKTVNELAVPNKFLSALELQGNVVDLTRKSQTDDFSRQVAVYRAIFEPNELQRLADVTDLLQSVSSIQNRTGSNTAFNQEFQRRLDVESLKTKTSPEVIINAFGILGRGYSRIRDSISGSLGQKVREERLEAYQDMIIDQILNPNSDGQILKKMEKSFPAYYATATNILREMTQNVAEGQVEPIEQQLEQKATEPSRQEIERVERDIDALQNSQSAVDMSPQESVFEPLSQGPSAAPTLGQIDPAMSPTILPSDKDRELAMRLRGPLGGIASLA